MPKLTTTTTLFVSIDFWFWYMSYKWDCIIHLPASARGSHCLLHMVEASTLPLNYVPSSWLFFFFFVACCFETRSCSVAEASLELIM